MTSPIHRILLLRLVPLISLLTPHTLAQLPFYDGDPNFLFVGNSYTGQNGLGNNFKSILQDAIPEWTDSVTIDSNNPPGRTLAAHVEAMETGSNNAGRRLAAALVGDTALNWKWVTLQDQSQVPAFVEWDFEGQGYYNSRMAAIQLNELIEATGGQTVFFLTWGRRNGLKDSELFPDFQTMQDLLTEGYMGYRESTTREDRPTFIAPVGLVFQTIHDDLVAQGVTPTDEGTTFHSLYTNDGSHPSPWGTYVAALTIFTTQFGMDPTVINWWPDNLDEPQARVLQDAVGRTILETYSSGFITYPWTDPWRTNTTSGTAMTTIQPTAPTPAPTALPATSAPTPQPTSEPTLQPTLDPTPAATLAPSALPATPAPTSQPTSGATSQPTSGSTPGADLGATGTSQPGTTPVTQAPTATPASPATPEPTSQPTSGATPQPTSGLTPGATPQPTATPASTTKGSISIQIQYDNFPQDIAWTFLPQGGAQALYFQPYDALTTPGTNQTKTFTNLSQNETYLFKIHDRRGDGLCCEEGLGSVVITDDNNFGRSTILFDLGAALGAYYEVDLTVGEYGQATVVHKADEYVPSTWPDLETQIWAPNNITAEPQWPGAFPSNPTYSLVVNMDLDDHPQEVAWEFFYGTLNNKTNQTDNDPSNDWERINAWAGSSAIVGTLDTTEMSNLQGGSYRFVVTDSAENGLCCNPNSTHSGYITLTGPLSATQSLGLIWGSDGQFGSKASVLFRMDQMGYVSHVQWESDTGTRAPTSAPNSTTAPTTAISQVDRLEATSKPGATQPPAPQQTAAYVPTSAESWPPGEGVLVSAAQHKMSSGTGLLVGLLLSLLTFL